MPKIANTQAVKTSNSKAVLRKNKTAKTPDTTKNTKATKPAPKKQVGGSKSTAVVTAPKNEPKKRYFKRVDPVDGKMYGRYTGKTPKQAASKAYTKLRKAMREKGQKIPKLMTIYVRESTRNSAQKLYAYQAWIVKLDDPQELTIPDSNGKEDKEIQYRYRNKVKKVSLPNQLAGMKIVKSKLQKPPRVKAEAKKAKTTTDTKNTKTKQTENKKSVSKKANKRKQKQPLKKSSEIDAEA